MSDSKKVELISEFRDLIFTAVKLYADGNIQTNLGSESAQHNLATFIAGYLSSFIADCEDEINSLQFMLDELNASQAALGSPKFKQELSDNIEMQIAKLKMMNLNKGDA